MKHLTPQCHALFDASLAVRAEILRVEMKLDQSCVIHLDVNRHPLIVSCGTPAPSWQQYPFLPLCLSLFLYIHIFIQHHSPS